MDLVIVITCCVAISLLSLLILVRNPTQPNNQRFAVIASTLVLWSVFNYLSDNASVLNLLYTRLTFIFGALAMLAFVQLAANYPKKTSVSGSVWMKLHLAISIILLPTMFSSMFISSVSIDTRGQGSIHTGYLYYIFLAYAAYSATLLIASWMSQRTASKTQLEKQQTALLFGGIFAFAVLAVTANVIIPLVFDSWSSTRFGPFFTLLFVAVIAQAIITTRLFDIHSFAIRAAAYTSTLFLVGTFFVAPFVLLIGHFFNFRLTPTEFIAITVACVAASYALQHVRRRFDHLTKRVFYRNYYESQDVLEKLSDILVRTPEIDALCVKSGELLAKVLQAHEVKYYLMETADESTRKLLRAMLNENANLLVADNLLQTDSKLAAKLKEARISLAVKLRTRHENLGYLTLGFKRSGELYTSRDLQLLSTAADEIAISLQNALRRQEIEQFNVTLQQKVIEATKELKAANARLKQLNESKDDFIGMASHQLRTPLTSIKGYISLVIDGDAGKINKDQKKLLQQAFFSSQKMVFLVADLLNVSRLKTGKFVIERGKVNIDKLISEEMEQLKQEAAGRGLELTYEAPKDFPTLPLDETKTRQVIMNFLDNAIYYTPSGGHVRVELKDLPKSVELRVIDDGIGVPKDERHHLFTKFYRARNAQRARPDGTGLGLYMAQKVITAQGGAIIFSSEEGKGSTFGFIFPKDMPEGMVALPAQTRD